MIIKTSYIVTLTLARGLSVTKLCAKAFINSFEKSVCDVQHIKTSWFLDGIFTLTLNRYVRFPYVGFFFLLGFCYVPAGI